MDLVTISLDALLQRATNAKNVNVDTLAVEGFCGLINKEKEGPTIGVKLLATRMHSKQEQEVLQTLHILDYSMRKCGHAFQEEIGKFRFLNEMIKLVSPKYLGSHTAPSVKQKVLQLMYLWMLDYPKQTKIKDAYDMLKKQGVIKEVPLSVTADSSQDSRNNCTVFQDEEKGKLLKKLLQSKNPEDLQAANRLIKTMVKEDEKKAELKSRKILELESVQNNIRLLNEMLDSYKSGVSSQDELDLIKELHESCLRMRPNIAKLASETHQNDEILGEILRVNDELGQVFDKYQFVLHFGKEIDNASQLSLLDIPSYEKPKENYENKSNEEVLCDILTTPLNDHTDDILKPTNVEMLKPQCMEANSDKACKSNREKALDELDALSETLLKENLKGTQIRLDKIPMNQLIKQLSNEALSTDTLEKPSSCTVSANVNDTNSDDLLVDISEPSEPQLLIAHEGETVKPTLKLSEIFVDLQSIKPSTKAPITLLDEKNGVTLTMHFAKDKPHEDVSVVVVTMVSKNELPLRNVLFRAIVPKSCKVKLQQASGTDLPPFNPFLPAAAITQIMLINNPEHVPVISLKYVVSYNVEDETMTEMGEIDRMPI